MIENINKDIYSKISSDSLLKDCSTAYSIYNHMKSKRYGGIFYLQFVQYHSMLCTSILDDYYIKDIDHINIKRKDYEEILKKVRVKFKLYSEKSITSYKNDLENIHSQWYEFMKDHSWDVDFGVFSVSGKYIGNTILDSWHLNEFLDIKEINSKQQEEYIKLFGEGMGDILRFMCDKYSIQSKKIILKPELQVEDNNFPLYRSNTIIFNDKYDKYISLLLFNILCSVNFVLYFLGKILPKNNEFYFRVKFICYDSSISSLRKLINYSEQNTAIETGVKNYTNKIEELERLKKLINDRSNNSSELRNCMAHYKISENSIKEQDILNNVPFYGLIEQYSGKDYDSLNEEISDNLKNISLLLETWVLNN